MHIFCEVLLITIKRFEAKVGKILCLDPSFWFRGEILINFRGTARKEIVSERTQISDGYFTSSREADNYFIWVAFSVFILKMMAGKLN